MALSTKKALADSLRALLAVRTLDKITVRDIVDECGVNRQTFYYHFHDVYDLLEWIFEDKIETMRQEGLSYTDWSKGLDMIVRHMLSDRKVILNAYHSVSHSAVSRFIKKWLHPFVEFWVNRESQMVPVDDADKDFVVDLFTFGLTGFLIEWVEDQMNELPEGELEKLKVAMEGSAGSVLVRLAASRD